MIPPKWLMTSLVFLIKSKIKTMIKEISRHLTKKQKIFSIKKVKWMTSSESMKKMNDLR
jgi:hypothetical protein